MLMLRVKMTLLVSPTSSPVHHVLTFFIEELLAIGPAVDPDDVVLLEICKSSILAIVITLMSFISVPSTSHHVDNDVNVDFAVEQLAPNSPAHVVREVAPEPPAPQPSNLDYSWHTFHSMSRLGASSGSILLSDAYHSGTQLQHSR
jgi:hypothetical protein